MQRHFVSFGANIASREIMAQDTRLHTTAHRNGKRQPNRLARKFSLYNDDEPLRNQDEDARMRKMADPAIPQEIKCLIKLLDQEREKTMHISYGLMHRPHREAAELLATEQGKYAEALTTRLLEEEWLSELALQAEPKTNQGSPFCLEINNGENQSQQIRSVFRHSEEHIINAYSGLLNNPFLDAETRLMLRKQRNGMLYSFLCVKLADEYPGSTQYTRV